MEIVDLTKNNEVIKKLTQMNINDLKTKFHEIFEGNFPKDINELEDFLITSVAMYIMPDDTFKKWNRYFYVSYSGTNRTSYTTVSFLVDNEIVQISGLSTKRKGDKYNRYVGMMLALMNCCEVHLTMEELNESNT